jgi:putative redox protein
MIALLACKNKRKFKQRIKMSTKHTIRTEWKGDLAFEADVNGHKVLMDAPIDGGGTDLGPSPKKLMLVALSGCTGMDVVSILKKMRVEIEKCSVEVEGDVTDEHPKHYYKMHVIYKFTGKSLPLDKLEKAVKMSEDTYCGVGALYRKAIEVTSEIRVIES